MKKLMLIIVCLLSINALAQDITRKGRWLVVKGTDTLSVHNEPHVAYNKQREYVELYKESVSVIPPSYTMDYVGEPDVVIPTTREVDTLLVTECFEDYNEKIWLWTTDTHVWVPFKETGFSHVQVDSLPVWKKMYQDKWRVERTKTFGEVQYKELDIPFQFYVKDSVVSIEPTVVKVRVFGNEDWAPEYIVNGESRGILDFSPGYQDFNGVETRRHSCTIDGLTPGTEYTIVVKGHSRVSEETDEAVFNVTTPAQ